MEAPFSLLVTEASFESESETVSSTLYSVLSKNGTSKYRYSKSPMELSP